MKTNVAVLALVAAIVCGLGAVEANAAGPNRRHANQVSAYSGRGYVASPSYGYARTYQPRNNYFYAPGGYMGGYGGRGLYVNPYMYGGYAEGKMGFSRLH